MKKQLIAALAVVATIGLTGCNNEEAKQAFKECQANNPELSAFWDCQRDIAPRLGITINAAENSYMVQGDAVIEEYRAGKITQIAAKARLMKIYDSTVVQAKRDWDKQNQICTFVAGMMICS